MSASSAQHVNSRLNVETDSPTTALAMMTHINATRDPCSRESWPSRCDIEACRHVNGTRHIFAIHDVGGSGNPVLRRGGHHAIRVLGRKATEGR
jgi:hypothetical protein